MPEGFFYVVRQAWRVVRKHQMIDCGGQSLTWGCKSPADPDDGNR